MSKDWQYASLGESERLDLIKRGNEDVYSSEKKRTSTLKDLRMNLGLSTGEVDRWDDLVEDARKQYTSGQLLNRKDIDAITGSRTQSASYMLNSELGSIRDGIAASKEKAVKSAEKELESVAEWLASNGYSVKSNTAKKAKNEIEDELIRTLRLLESQYKQKSAEALASAVAKFR